MGFRGGLRVGLRVELERNLFFVWRLIELKVSGNKSGGAGTEKTEINH